MRIPRLKPWQGGLIIGLVSSIVQATYFALPKAVEGYASYKVAPPAYGFCMWCHTRDLTNWLLKEAAPSVSDVGINPAPISIIAPTMTIVGIFIAATLTAFITKEFRWKWTYNPILTFVSGLGVSFAAAAMGACPLRILVRAGYLEPVAFVAVGVIGVAVAFTTYTVLMRYPGAG